MVIGSGMMGKAFSMYQDNSAVLIFASGVSNSRETERIAFEREESALVEALRDNADKSFMYFSTCSIADPEAGRTPYVLHKLKMEGLISSAHSRHFIFRLPQVVGISANRTTLLNYFYDMIIKSEPFTVWKNANRNLIDVEDVVKIAGYIIDNQLCRNSVQNIAALHYPVLEIVQLLEKIAGVKGVYTLIDRGTPFDIDNSLTLKIADELKIIFDEGYLERTLRKYYALGNTRQT